MPSPYFCAHHLKWYHADFTAVPYKPETLDPSCPCCRDFDFTGKVDSMRDRHWSEETTPDLGHGKPPECFGHAIRDAHWARARLDDPCASAAVLQEARQIIAAERAALEGYANTSSYGSPDQFVD